MRLLSRRTRALALAIATLCTTACVHAFWKTEAVALERPAADVDIRTPVKAHLADGSTVVFRNGAHVGSTTVEGDGQVYRLHQSDDATRFARPVVIPFDSIVGLETFQGKLLAAPSVVVSTAATAVTAVAAGALLKVLFGSCPTVYADTGAGPELQAEGFSYAIAPLLEQRDLDPLNLARDRDGVVRLELRNEALETHYINNLELVAVTHRAGARALPDQSGHVVVVDGLRPIDAAHDRAGRDVLSALSAADGQLFASSPETVRNARSGDLADWIDIDASGLPPGDSVAVVLRLRNSLLNTVLLYDGMLGGRDAPDWMETSLQRISTAVELSKWYGRTMGMRATVAGLASRSASEPWTARLGDVGPLAFRDVAVVLPRPRSNARSIRVRLDFVADNWRIDQVMIASRISRPATRILPVSRVLVRDPENMATINDTSAIAALREPDGRYLQTLPGQRMTLEFKAARTDSASVTSYLIAWQGWYSEWIRGAWLAEPTRRAAWQPGDGAVLTALQRWESRKTELEQAFYSSRIPVR